MEVRLTVPESTFGSFEGLGAVHSTAVQPSFRRLRAVNSSLAHFMFDMRPMFLIIIRSLSTSINLRRW